MNDECSTTTRTLALFPQAEIDPDNRLLADYLLSLPAARDLFAHEPEEMLEIARHTRAQADRAELAQALVAFQTHLGADDAAVQAASLLADPETPVVTAGQQSGLLTGPLYTIYKAITTINVAHRLAQQLGRPVVPVFWAATDDDDRTETDHCACWDQHYVAHTLRYPEEAGQPGQLIGALPAGCEGEKVLAQLDPLIAGMPFAAKTREMLAGTLEDSADMGEWFCRLMARLFSRWGLVLCDPRLPAVRRLAAEVLLREVAIPLDSTKRVNERARLLQQRGYRPQLTKPTDVCNIFRLNGARQRVSYRDGCFRIAGESFTPEDMQASIHDDPTQWAPNAVLRPVVQEYLLGSTAFIAGPNELGYWAELQPVFDALGVNMPPVLPRAAATLVPRGIARNLQTWNMNPLHLLIDYDQVRLRLLEEQQPESVRQGFAAGRSEIEQLVSRLVPLVSSVDDTLAQSALAAHQRMLNELERLERKTLRAVERQSSELMERLGHVRQVLFPHRGLQERTLNIFCLLARYGPDLLDQLRTLLDQEEGRHLFVEI